MDTVFETPRLLAREMSLDDLDFVAGQLGDADQMRFYPAPLTRGESARWIERQIARYRADGHGLWLILRRTSNEPVGQVGLLRQIVRGAAELEIGYLIHPLCWRRGYASEAAAATRDLVFATMEAHRVISLIRPGNLPSRGVAETIGMQPVDRVLHAGLDHLVYALTREEHLASSSGIAGATTGRLPWSGPQPGSRSCTS